MEKAPVYRSSSALTCTTVDYLQFSNHLTCIFLDCGKIVQTNTGIKPRDLTVRQQRRLLQHCAGFNSSAFVWLTVLCFLLPHSTHLKFSFAASLSLLIGLSHPCEPLTPVAVNSIITLAAVVLCWALQRMVSLSLSVAGCGAVYAVMPLSLPFACSEIQWRQVTDILDLAAACSMEMMPSIPSQ